ncbi:MAG: hypothetical protein HY819_18745 [Acidobacteria bacterium]|nr:hypothetical protein [Acidobacteriota bacterium]
MINIEEPQSNKFQSRLPFWLLLWPLAFILRITNFYGVFIDGKVFLSSTDPYYHLRRTLLTLNNFPYVPDFDPYLNFPIGAATHWPFGFDIIMAAIVSCLTLGQADKWWTEAISALLPAVMGSFLPIVVYFFLIKITDKFTSLFGGIITALLPPAIFFSQIGNFDHHFLAALFQGLFFLTYLQASKEKKSFWKILPSIILLIGFTSTTEFPFVIAIHCIYLLIVYFTVTKERQNQLILINLKIFVGVSVLLLPFIFTNYFEPSGVSPLLASSWFGCLLFTLFLMALATIKKLTPIWLLAVAFFLGIIFFISFDFSLITKLLAEANQSQGNNVLGSSIRENHSMLSDGLSYLLYWHTGFLILLPVMIIVLITKRSEVNLLILISLIIIQTLALAHMRLSVLLPIPFALASALLLKEGFVLAKNHFSKNHLGEILMILLTFLLLLPSILGIDFFSRVIVIGHKDFLLLYDSFTWLKQHSPEINPKQPSYGVIANEWDLGHWLVYFSERPTISSPLLHTPELAKAVSDGAKIFVEAPAQALNSLDKRKIKYIFFTPDDVIYLIEIAGIKAPKEGENFDSLYGRLLASYGFPQGTVTHPTLNRIRLVYEGKKLEGDPPLPSSMIFEIVKGARLKGQVKPNSSVTINAQIKTTNNRRIPYLSTVKADEKGNFDFIVPYSTNLDDTTTTFVSLYVIKSDDLLASIKVTTEQVRNGDEILVNFLVPQ